MPFHNTPGHEMGSILFVNIIIQKKVKSDNVPWIAPLVCRQGAMVH